jgi:protein-disulfide isomerase
MDELIKQEQRTKFDSTKFLVPGAIIIAGILISVAIIYSNGGFNNNLANIKDSLEPRKTVSVDDDPYLGKKNAPITMIEFSDFQCPFCRSFWRDTLPLIKSEFIDTGKLKFVYRDFPLSFHEGAMPAAQATECAKDQDKYWEMHDKIFEEQAKKGSGTISFNNSDLKKWAGEIGLKMDLFNSCFDSGKYVEEIRKDMEDGQAAGVTGTPAFFINGRLVVGAQPYSVFKNIIEEELSKK